MTEESFPLSKKWDLKAREVKKINPAGWHSYYHGKSFLIAVEKALNYLSLKNKIRLLKTDLWNEGIETSRDILGVLENNSQIELYGIDISSEVLQAAQKRLKRTQIIQGDIRCLPFPDQFFDIIIDLSTIDHLPERYVPQVLQEYYRVLKNKGVLLIIFCYNSFLVRISKMLKFKQEDGYQYYFHLKKTKSLVEKQFIIKENYVIGLLKSLPWGFFLKRLPKKVSRFTCMLFNKLEYFKYSHILLKPFGELYVIICTKK